MVASVSSVNDTNFKNSECGHIALVQPVLWCCRQIYNIGNVKGAAGSNQCARVASKMCHVALAIILFLPSAALALIGLMFSCAFSKKAAGVVIPSTIKPNALSKSAAKPSALPKSAVPRIASQPPAKVKWSPLYPSSVIPTPPGQYIFPPPPKKAEPAVVITREDLTKFELEDLEFEPNVPGITKDEILTNKAMAFFEDPMVSGRQSLDIDFSALGEFAKDRNIIDALFENNDRFVIGELHDNIASKLFLINNMEYLKSKGVTTLFWEMPNFYKQTALDAYQSGACDASEPQVKEFIDYIKRADDYWGLPHEGSYKRLMDSAIKHGIRLVLMDYDMPGNFTVPGRFVRMNYVAAKVIAKEIRSFKPNEKFVALTGMMHLAQLQTDPNPGMSELLQCPAVGIMQNRENPNVRRVVYGDYPISEAKYVGNRHITILDKS